MRLSVAEGSKPRFGDGRMCSFDGEPSEQNRPSVDKALTWQLDGVDLHSNLLVKLVHWDFNAGH